MKLLRWLAACVVLVLAGLAAIVAWKFFHRPGLEAYAAHRFVSPATTGGLNATWFGTTALLLSDGEHSLMVDPYFTRAEGWLNLLLNREIASDQERIARALVKAKLNNLEAVLVSHSHFDHAMDAGVVARLSGAVLAGSASTANIGRGEGVPESQLRMVKPGEPMTFGSFTVTFLESKHAGATGGTPTGAITQPLKSPAHYLDYKLGGAYSILIEHPLGTVLHHGSAGFIPGALKGKKADVVFLGIALLDDLPAYLSEVVDAVGAKRVIPTHWDDFTRPLDQPLIPGPIGVHLDDFFEDMARLRPALTVQTLTAGETVTLFPNP